MLELVSSSSPLAFVLSFHRRLIIIKPHVKLCASSYSAPFYSFAVLYARICEFYTGEPRRKNFILQPSDHLDSMLTVSNKALFARRQPLRTRLWKPFIRQVLLKRLVSINRVVFLRKLCHFPSRKLFRGVSFSISCGSLLQLVLRL